MWKLIKYIGFGILVIPLTIVTHEFGHFVAYKLFGASNVVLHSVSVSADKDALSASQIAFAAIVGPIISYLTIAAAIFLTNKRYVLFWIFVGLAAPIGRIVNFIYVYFRTLGYQPNPNFDEFNFARSLGIDPLGPAIFTCLIVLATLGIFLRKAWIAGGAREVVMLTLGLAVGLGLWSLVGPVVLP